MACAAAAACSACLTKPPGSADACARHCCGGAGSAGADAARLHRWRCCGADVPVTWKRCPAPSSSASVASDLFWPGYSCSQRRSSKMQTPGGGQEAGGGGRRQAEHGTHSWLAGEGCAWEGARRRAWHENAASTACTTPAAPHLHGGQSMRRSSHPPQHSGGFSFFGQPAQAWARLGMAAVSNRKGTLPGGGGGGSSTRPAAAEACPVPVLRCKQGHR